MISLLLPLCERTCVVKAFLLKHTTAQLARAPRDLRRARVCALPVLCLRRNCGCAIPTARILFAVQLQANPYSAIG